MQPAVRAEPIYAAPPRIIEDPPATDNAILDFFLAYWREKRGAHALPSRDAISTREIKHHLGWVCLIDALPEYKEFRYRLVGSLVADYFLNDGTGKTVTEAFAGGNELLGNGAIWLYRRTCLLKKPLLVEGRAGTWGGRYYPENIALYLPLARDGEAADMVLNVFTFDLDSYRRTQTRYSLSHAV